MQNNNLKKNIYTMPIELVLCNLPYKKVEENIFIREYKRKKIKLIISQNNKNHSIPYGIYSRLILYYITSEVKRLKNKGVKFGKNFTEMLNNIYILDNNKNIKNIGAAKEKIKQQFTNLINSTITIEYQNNKKINKKILFFENNQEFWKNNQNNKGNFTLELSEEYYQYLLKSSSTIFDKDLLINFKSSPMLMDIYIYFNYQAYNANTFNKDIKIDLDDLYNQFGTKTSQKEFKRLLKNNLKKINNLPIYLKFDKNNIIISKHSTFVINSKI